MGVNLHDNDLVPIDATPAERDAIVAEFKQVLVDTGLTVPMATTNLFSDPVFRDGAFTSSDPAVRDYALQKTMRAIDLGVELGARVYVFWGGRKAPRPTPGKPAGRAEMVSRGAQFLTAYVRDQHYDPVFALEAKPNEPRGDIYLPTTGAMLGFIASLDHPEMVGVNPEVAHEHMAGLNFLHAVAQAWDAGKLFHIDLNDQAFGRYDQDFRFGSHSIKQAFFLVKFLEEVEYAGSRHFDAHAYRTEDLDGVRAFARGCMRSYLVLKERARQWNEDREIQALVAELSPQDGAVASGGFDCARAAALKARPFDRASLGSRGRGERLDQLTVECLPGDAA